MAQEKKQDPGTRLILWVFVYWWFYPLRWLFYTLPHKFIDRKKRETEYDYIVNLETLIVHRADCAHVRAKDIDFNKFATLHCKYAEIDALGYKPCASCHPERL